MKHATPATLAALDDLLASLRELPGLIEKKTGTFYRKSQAFLHFHEDDDGIAHADVKQDGQWQRYRVATVKERKALVRAVRAFLAPP